MRKILISLLTVGLFSLGPIEPVGAENFEPFDVCQTPNSEFCIVSIEINGPGTNGFIRLDRDRSVSSEVAFVANETYQPSTGNRKFAVIGQYTDWPSSLGGRQIGGISVTPGGGDPFAGIDPETTVRISVNAARNMPGPAISKLDRGDYQIDLIDGVYRITIQSKPLGIVAMGVSNLDPNKSVQIANAESRGLFNVGFFPSVASIANQSVYTGLSPSTDRAWFAIETNAQTVMAPMWINGALVLNVAGPHFLLDGSTLNAGKYRMVMTNQMITDSFGMSLEQALGGALVAQTNETGEIAGSIGSSLTRTNEKMMELNLATFHYSARDIAVKPSVSLKSSSVSWTGKKSSIKRNKALTVNSSVKSNKKKAAGTMRVDLVNSAGVVVGSLNSNVKKGSGKVTFSKSFTKQLAPGKYTVKINYFGSGTAKNTSRSYSLKVK